MADRQTDKAHWDSIYLRRTEDGRQRSLAGRLKRAFRSLTARWPWIVSYPNYLLWARIYPQYMPSGSAKKLVEIGSGTGTRLVKIHERYGLEPYGIEYSQPAVELCRRAFLAANINPDNVIHMDFLSERLDREYKEFFDIVLSAGLIEHFRAPEDLIDKHLNILKPGGVLFVSIPRYVGLNCFLKWLFDRQALGKHNLDIMRADSFARLFKRSDLRRLFCGFYGTHVLSALLPGGVARPRRVLSFLLRCFCVMTNVLCRAIMAERGFENSLTSPHLLFVGVKKCSQVP